MKQTTRVSEFYQYIVPVFSALAAGGSATQIVNIESDSDFEIQKLMYFADVAAGAQTDSSRIIPLCTATIVDQSSGRQISSLPTPVTALFGTGQEPFILPTPKIFPARSSISVTVANFSVATTYNLRLILAGRKIYRM